MWYVCISARAQYNTGDILKVCWDMCPNWEVCHCTNILWHMLKLTPVWIHIFYYMCSSGHVCYCRNVLLTRIQLDTFYTVQTFVVTFARIDTCFAIHRVVYLKLPKNSCYFDLMLLALSSVQRNFCQTPYNVNKLKSERVEIMFTNFATAQGHCAV